MGEGKAAANRIERGGPWLAALLILLAAVATRFVTFGNPVVIQDDQFYLLVGDAMSQGLWPYLDIWDRKPVGLFLLFAGIASIGGTSILIMQLAATAFAAATAWLIRHVALRFTGAAGALMAALAYLFMLPLFGGQSGQSPVFYNLFMVGAFALLADYAVQDPFVLSMSKDRSIPSSGEEQSFDKLRTKGRVRAFGAMLLCGVTLTIKPVAVAEGVFIGLAFLWLLGRQGEQGARIVGMGAAMVAVALLPSLAALAAYAANGQAALDANVHANFISIFQKAGLGGEARLAGLGFFALYIVPLLLFAAIGAARRWKETPRDPLALLLLGWMVAATVGYLLVPNFFDHYALPLLPPLCVSAASLFARRDGPIFFAVIPLFALFQGAVTDWSGNRRASIEMAALGRTIEEARRGGCLFVADGPAWLYAQSPACRVTPYLFPGHLTLLVEEDALGVDQHRELARVLAQRPAVIVAQDSERDQHRPAIDRLLYTTLERDYRNVARVPDDASPRLATVRVWQRRDLSPPRR